MQVFHNRSAIDLAAKLCYSWKLCPGQEASRGGGVEFHPAVMNISAVPARLTGRDLSSFVKSRVQRAVIRTMRGKSGARVRAGISRCEWRT
jgi:hypothetical protein